jgi:hypothetical protein
MHGIVSGVGNVALRGVRILCIKSTNKRSPFSFLCALPRSAFLFPLPFSSQTSVRVTNNLYQNLHPLASDGWFFNISTQAVI